MDGPDAREDLSWARSRSGTTPRSRRSTRASLCRVTKIAVVHRSRQLGHDLQLHRLPLQGQRARGSRGSASASAVNWPVGAGQRGSAGVAAGVSQTPGGIGYVDVAFALKNHLKFFSMKNASGKFATPGLKGILAAATSDQKPTAGTNELSIVNPPKKFPLAYPIATYTYVIAPTQSPKAAGPQQVPVLGCDKGADVRARSCSSSRSRSRCSSSRRRRSRRSRASGRMTSAELTPEATRRPFTGRRVRVGDLVLQVVAGTAAAAATVLVGLITWKVIDGRVACDRGVRLRLRHPDRWNPVLGHELYGAGSFLFGTAVTSLRRTRDRRAARDRSRALPHRARPDACCAGP